MEPREVFGRKLYLPTVVAEIGCNHGGSMATAKEMIRVAAACGAGIVKFQKRDVDAIPEQIKHRPRYDAHSFGATEMEHRRVLEFSSEQHREILRYCESFGVQYACSAWDERSFGELVDLGVEYVKIPSAKNQEYQTWSLKEGNKGILPLHVSLGMLSQEERNKVLDGMSVSDVPYACTSKYPSRMEDVYLRELTDLHEYDSHKFNRVGFSGHHNGIAVDLGAFLLGASYIERHFTLDRTAKGTDHAASLEPTGLLKLVRDIKALWCALQRKPLGLPEAEVECRKKMKGA